jgi:hypothetical protein
MSNNTFLSNTENTHPSLSVRECVQRNYIPNPTPRNANYNKWSTAYHEHLLNLFDIFRGKIDTYKNWDEKTFDTFCVMIWNCSSKHISPYLES